MESCVWLKIDNLKGGCDVCPTLLILIVLRKKINKGGIRHMDYTAHLNGPTFYQLNGAIHSQ
jgi:hypothetical protein